MIIHFVDSIQDSYDYAVDSTKDSVDSGFKLMSDTRGKLSSLNKQSLE